MTSPIDPYTQDAKPKMNILEAIQAGKKVELSNGEKIVETFFPKEPLLTRIIVASDLGKVYLFDQYGNCSQRMLSVHLKLVKNTKWINVPFFPDGIDVYDSEQEALGAMKLGCKYHCVAVKVEDWQ